MKFLLVTLILILSATEATATTVFFTNGAQLEASKIEDAGQSLKLTLPDGKELYYGKEVIDFTKTEIPPKPSPYDEIMGGFRNYKWGESEESFGSFIIAREGRPEFRFLKKENEDLNIGGVDVKEIIYSFFENKLYKVEIKYKSSYNFEALFNFLEKQYGNAHSTCKCNFEG